MALLAIVVCNGSDSIESNNNDDESVRLGCRSYNDLVGIEWGIDCLATYHTGTNATAAIKSHNGRSSLIVSLLGESYRFSMGLANLAFQNHPTLNYHYRSFDRCSNVHRNNINSDLCFRSGAPGHDPALRLGDSERPFRTENRSAGFTLQACCQRAGGASTTKSGSSSSSSWRDTVSRTVQKRQVVMS